MAVVGTVLGTVFSVIVSAGRLIISGATATLSWLFHFVMDWIVPKVVWLVQQVTNIVNWMSKVFDTVSSMIAKAVGEVIKYIDKSIALMDKAIADVVDMILKKLNVESKLLREWMIWYIEGKLKPLYDGLAEMRADLFQIALDIRRQLDKAITDIKSYFSVQVEWLDQRITINTDNWKSIFTEKGLIKEEKKEPLYNDLTLAYLTGRGDIVTTFLCSEEAKEEISSEPLVNMIENEVAIEQDMEDEPTMDGLIIREQAEVIAMLESLPNTYEEYFNVIREIGKKPKGEII